MGMKTIFICLSVFVGAAFTNANDALANANPNASLPITMGVIDNSSKEAFESKVLPWLKTQLSGCKNCEIRNLSAYDEEGNFDVSKISEQIETAKSSISFLFLSWNEKVSDKTQEFLTTLKKASAEGVIVVGPAGLPKENEASAPLSRTILGQVPNALIIGELGEKDRLIAASYFGPEMLTAIRPTKDLIGQGYSPALFAVKFASQFSRKSPADWMSHIKSKKASNRKIWLGLDDIFR
jgi:hypothetical protein